MVMQYTIDGFWSPRLQSSDAKLADPAKLVQGWSLPDGLSTFKEAPLTKDASVVNGSDPECAKVLLVSAPGAVGKTTLAKQIAHKTSSIYVDLAAAGAVGAGTLLGGLAADPHGIQQAWRTGNVAVLIDGLDEGRLKVTQRAFTDFLEGVAGAYAARHVGTHALPTMIFGRTAAIEEAWRVLRDHVKVAVLKIGYYQRKEQIELAGLMIKDKDKIEKEKRRTVRGHNASSSDHAEGSCTSPQLEAATELLKQIGHKTANDSRFAGYAPVIDAVATRVFGEDNPYANITQKIQKGQHPITLNDIVTDILKREQNKLKEAIRDAFKDPLKGTLHEAFKELYSPHEQIQRLIARVYGVDAPPPPNWMTPKQSETYSDALVAWVPEHPFLGEGQKGATAVFDAVIRAEALRDKKAGAKALDRERDPSTTANSFLADFYADRTELGAEIPADHIGVVYSSLRAGLSAEGGARDTASLRVEELEDPTGDEDYDSLYRDVEIVIVRGAFWRRALTFRAYQGTVHLGAHVEDVNIVAPFAEVVIGGKEDLTLTSPVIIECKKLTVNALRVNVNASQDEWTAAVHLEAEQYEGSVEKVWRNEGVDLTCIWKGIGQYNAWRPFGRELVVAGHPGSEIENGLRRFRDFVMAFRSHGKGSLGRSPKKLRNRRMGKDSGDQILEAMVEHRIIETGARMYRLDQKKLTAVTGADYRSCAAHEYGEKAHDFVRDAISKDKT